MVYLYCVQVRFNHERDSYDGYNQNFEWFTSSCKAEKFAKSESAYMKDMELSDFATEYDEDGIDSLWSVRIWIVKFVKNQFNKEGVIAMMKTDPTKGELIKEFYLTDGADNA